MKLLGSLLSTLILVACGGGGGGDTPAAQTPPSVLSGTAAVGAPIVGATVTLSCAGGAVLTSAPSSSLGLWQVVLSGQTFPCAAQLKGGTINGVANTLQLHSVATSKGTLNITPLTDLVVANASRTSTPSTWYAAIQSAGFTTVNATSLNDALNLLVNMLNMVQITNAFNPLTTPFAPAAGNIIDDTLTALGQALKDIGIDYATLRSQVSVGPGFIPPSGIGAAIRMQYADTTSGIASGGVSSIPVVTNNPTTGQAANSSPTIAVANCTISAGNGSYARCQANAIANFGPVSIVNAADGQNCTATYSNGTLTVTKGNSTVFGYMNGDLLSDVNVFGTGTNMTTELINTFSSNGGTVQIASVNWNSTGSIIRIYGKSMTIAGALTEFSCTH
jgi:hypothetical protein